MVTDDPVVLLQLRAVKGRVRHKPIWKSNVREYGAHRGGEWRRRSASSTMGRQPLMLATGKMWSPEGEGVVGCFLSRKEVA
jgi:hypothetical protein